MELEGKVAVVTGASAGIGEAIARDLHARGAKLVLTARRADRLAALADELADAATLAADIAEPGTAERLLELATERFGRADILINNAGFLSMRPIDEVDLDHASAMIRVNFEAVVRASYVFARAFKRQGSGHIVNVSSVGAGLTVTTGGVYAATKAAVESFSAALRVELAGSGVKVGTIGPGSTKTEILDVARGHGEQTWDQRIRMLRPGDVAAAVRFMLEQPDHANVPRMQIFSADESV